MKHRKIIFTVINDLNYDQRMIRICKSLVNHGYDVLLVGRKLNNSKHLQNQSFQQKRFNCFFQKGKFFYLEYNLRLFFFLFCEKFDAVCAIDLDTILPAFYVSRWRKKKMIYDAHEYFTEVPEVVRRPRVKKIWEWVARKTIPRCTHCYTVGSSLANVFEEKYGTPFKVIRNVPEDDLIIPDVGENKDAVILYQGALNEGRGLEEMLEAMTAIEDAHFWLAGEGDLSDVLREKTKQLQLEKQVKFLGYLLPQELKKITHQATIGINFLHQTSLNYYYSLANKTFDYVLANVPAIHMAFPEYEDLMQDFEVGILIKDLKKETIIIAVNKLLKEKIFYQKLKDNCGNARQVWNWQQEEKKLIQFYKEIFQDDI